jgi:hypothetical protein
MDRVTHLSDALSDLALNLISKLSSFVDQAAASDNAQHGTNACDYIALMVPLYLKMELGFLMLKKAPAFAQTGLNVAHADALAQAKKELTSSVTHLAMPPTKSSDLGFIAMYKAYSMSATPFVEAIRSLANTCDVNLHGTMFTMKMEVGGDRWLWIHEADSEPELTPDSNVATTFVAFPFHSAGGTVAFGPPKLDPSPSTSANELMQAVCIYVPSVTRWMERRNREAFSKSSAQFYSGVELDDFSLQKDNYFNMRHIPSATSFAASPNTWQILWNWDGANMLLQEHVDTGASTVKVQFFHPDDSTELMWFHKNWVLDFKN